MQVLVACEFSGVVRDAFRDNGFEAWSCDILSSEGKYREFHYKTDIRNILVHYWDLVIAFPPCTHLSSSGARWFKEKRKDGRQQGAIDFFKLFTRLDCKWAIENPIGIMSTEYRKPDQIIQPWEFGHGETKATCLWLNKLPKLKATNIVEGREARIHKMPPSKDRSKLRSITYQGIANAMAEQWSPIKKAPNRN